MTDRPASAVSSSDKSYDKMQVCFRRLIGAEILSVFNQMNTVHVQNGYTVKQTDGKQPGH